MRRYVLGDVQSENMFINRMKFLVTKCINTTLLVMIHILLTQKRASQCNSTQTQFLIAQVFAISYINKKEPVIPILY